jgi:hypothetical protein
MSDTNSTNAATAEKPVADVEKKTEASATISTENGESKAAEVTGEPQATEGVENGKEGAPKAVESESAAAETGDKAASGEGRNDRQGFERRHNGNRGRGRGRGNRSQVNREERERRYDSIPEYGRVYLTKV